MTDYYRVSTDFLLGRNTQTDPRPDWLQPLDPKALPAFYETPVYVWDKGWALDVYKRQPVECTAISGKLRKGR